MNTFKKNWKIYVLLTVLVTLTVAAIAYVSVNFLYARFVTERTTTDKPLINGGDAEPDTLPKAFEDDTLNIFLMATDKDGIRTDSMMLIHYDQLTKTTSMFSVPRDYRLDVSDTLKDLIHYRRDHIKLTELHAYALNADHPSPPSVTTQAVEELLNVEIDHMVLLNIEGFKKLVDTLGGVEVNVPRDIDYDDYAQDLHIHLKAGVQLLDGDKAEQLLRFRKDKKGGGYDDFGRMQVQQYFVKAFAKKLLSAGSLFNIGSIYASMTEFVKTDATLDDAVGILKVVADADFSRVYSHQLPGENDNIGGVFYYSPPPREELIQYVADTLANDKTPVTDSKPLPLVVLNSSTKKGLAENYAARLTEKGFTVQETGNYRGSRHMKTQIIVPRVGLGHDLKAFFELSEVVVAPDRFKAEDPEHIIIILGDLEHE